MGQRAALLSANIQRFARSRTKQHDQYAMLNYYSKVSKYDLDRGDIDLTTAKLEKQRRRERNARHKR